MEAIQEETIQKVLNRCKSVTEILSTPATHDSYIWYASDEFGEEVEVLYANLEEYAKKLQSQKLPASSSIMKSVKKAGSTLEKAQQRLRIPRKSKDDCCSSAWWLWEKFVRIFSPDRLLKAITKLQDAVDKPKFLKEQLDSDEEVRKYFESLPNETLSFENRLYVPISASEEDISTAIEKTSGPSIILLHGETGTGKSMLGRWVCSVYGGDGEKGKKFDHVRYAGSPDATTEISQFLQNIDPTSRKRILIVLDELSDYNFFYEMRDIARSCEHAKYVLISESTLCDTLKDELKNDSIMIKMKDPNDNEAKKILASHIGLHRTSNNGRQEPFVPDHLKDIVGKIVQAAKNPLALTWLAKNFSDADKADSRRWQKVYNAFREHSNETTGSFCTAMKLSVDSLKTRDARLILFLVYSCEGGSVPEEVLEILHAPEKTSWSSFRRSMNELSQRKLIKKSQLNSASKDGDFQNSTIWSLGSLVSSYVGTEKVGQMEVKALIDGFKKSLNDGLNSQLELTQAGKKKKKGKKLPEDSALIKTKVDCELTKTKVQIGICALYFNQAHPDVTWAREQCNLNSNDNTDDHRRYAIEPIIWLLEQSKDNDQWTESPVHYARKIFLTYVCERQLDDENISSLLNLPGFLPAPLATLEAITRICQTEKATLFNNNSLSFAKPLVDLLKSTERMETNIWKAALRTLSSVSKKAAEDRSISLIINTPDVLSALMRSIKDSLQKPPRAEGSLVEPTGAVSSFFDKHAKTFLQGLAAGADSSELTTHRDGVSGEDWTSSYQKAALEGLTESLKHLQKVAGEVLAHITAAEGESTRTGKETVNDEDELTRLAKWVLLQHNPDLNFPESVKEDITWEIQHAGKIRSFVNSLGDDSNPLLQKGAREASSIPARREGESSRVTTVDEKGAVMGLKATLARAQGESIKMTIIHEKGAVAGLVKSWSQVENPRLRANAACALLELANADGKAANPYLDEIQTSAAKALVWLGKSLSDSKNPDLQVCAAKALVWLAEGEESMKLRILKEEKVVVSLVKSSLLLNNQDAALALGNLTKAVVSLVKSLHDEKSPNLQRIAALALGNLAAAEAEATELKNPKKGGLDGLDESSSGLDKGSQEQQAATAFGSSASGVGNPIALTIVSEGKAVEGLIKLLEHENKDLQEEAARALANLACAEDQIKLKILHEHGALASLVKSLDKPNLQESAARALRNLGRTEDSAIKEQLQDEGNLLTSLEKLSKEGNVSSQKQAKGALENLRLPKKKAAL